MGQVLLLLLFACATQQFVAADHGTVALWDAEAFLPKSSQKSEVIPKTFDDNLCDRQLAAFRTAFDSREMWSLRRN